MPTIFKDKVICNGVTFNDPLALPSGAQRFAIDEMPGWKNGPSIDYTTNKILGLPGEVLNSEQSPKARYMTVGGYVLAATRAQADALADTLVAAAFPLNKDLRLERYEPVPKFVTARRIGPVEVSSQDIGLGFRFSVDLICQTPYKFGVTPVGPLSAGVAGLSSGGRTYSRRYPLQYTAIISSNATSVTLTNAGTAESAPTIVLTGPLVKGGWRLSNETTDEIISMDVGLAFGDVLTIDFGNELVYLNGSLISPNVTGDFFRIVNGPNVLRLYADYDPSAGFTASAFSAWE